jgi:hypothetical protein
MAYSSKYNIGFIRNSTIKWQNSQHGSKGYVAFANWESGVRANSVNAVAKVTKGPRTIYNENGVKETVNPLKDPSKPSVADLPSLTRVNTPPRTASGGIENDGAFKNKFGAPGSDAYNYGQYYDNVKKGMQEYINKPDNGLSAAEKTKALTALNNNELDTSNNAQMEAYNYGIMKAEHGAKDANELYANKDKLKQGVAAGLKQTTLAETTPNDSDVPPKVVPTPPVAQAPAPVAPRSDADLKRKEEFRRQQMARLKSMIDRENILNKFNQQ